MYIYIHMYMYICTTYIYIYVCVCVCCAKYEFSLEKSWFRTTIYCNPPKYLSIILTHVLTTSTVTFSISSSLYCPPQTLTTNTVHIQYQFLSILPSPDPHKNSNIQYQFLSLLPSPGPHNKHSTHSVSVPLYIALPRNSQQTQ